MAMKRLERVDADRQIIALLERQNQLLDQLLEQVRQLNGHLMMRR